MQSDDEFDWIPVGPSRMSVSEFTPPTVDMNCGDQYGVFVDEAAVGEDHTVIRWHSLEVVIVGGGFHGLDALHRSAYLAGAGSKSSISRLCLMLMSHGISFEEMGPPVDLLDDIENINFAPAKLSFLPGREWIEHKKRASKKTGIKSAKRAAKRRRGK